MTIFAIILTLMTMFRNYEDIQAVEIYPMSAYVTEVSAESDLVIVQDFNGNKWSFRGSDDWLEGDMCALLMCDNGTSEWIYDDIILDVKYSGFIE